jgi:hypothetical protein
MIQEVKNETIRKSYKHKIYIGEAFTNEEKELYLKDNNITLEEGEYFGDKEGQYPHIIYSQTRHNRLITYEGNVKNKPTIILENSYYYFSHIFPDPEPHKEILEEFGYKKIHSNICKSAMDIWVPIE